MVGGCDGYLQKAQVDGGRVSVRVNSLVFGCCYHSNDHGSSERHPAWRVLTKILQAHHPLGKVDQLRTACPNNSK